MGIQIYIKKSAVKIDQESRTINYMYDENDEVYDQYESHYVTLIGLDVVMQDFDDYVYSDANVWGSNRGPLLEYIEANNISDDDWYEA
jgi:hypothetical protein